MVETNITRHPPEADRPCNPFLASADKKSSAGVVLISAKLCPWGVDTPLV